MTPTTAQRFAGRLAGSGIAAGAIASRHIAMLCGYENSIGLDMGGTSCDVSLVYGRQSRVTKDWGIEFGHPIRFPSIEVLTIGAVAAPSAHAFEGEQWRNSSTMPLSWMPLSFDEDSVEDPAEEKVDPPTFDSDEGKKSFIEGQEQFEQLAWRDAGRSLPWHARPVPIAARES
jgi:hypothetical protein